MPGWRSGSARVLWIGALIGVNVSIALFREWLRATGQIDWPVLLGALQPEALLNGAWWQLVTYQFLHAGLAGVLTLHLVINCLMIWIFGRPLIQQLGAGRFFALYLGGGAIAGCFHLAEALLRWQLGIVSPFYAVGASGSICALVGAFAYLHPSVRMFVFPIPVPMRAATLFKVTCLLSLALAGYDLWQAWMPGGGSTGIAHSIHLGGLLTGWLWMRRLEERRWRRRLRVPQAVVRDAEAELLLELESELAQYEREQLQAEVDRVLDRIRTRGLHSLSPRDLLILHIAQRRL